MTTLAAAWLGIVGAAVLVALSQTQQTTHVSYHPLQEEEVMGSKHPQWHHRLAPTIRLLQSAQSSSSQSSYSVYTSVGPPPQTQLPPQNLPNEERPVATSTSFMYSQEQEKQEHHTHQQQHVFSHDHPPLFPLTSATIWGFVWAILSLIIAAGGGIGGGGLLVPVYTLVMGFSPKHAIPLSNVTVFGGALANTYLNLPKRHPSADRPLVDWDLILVMEPLTIAGALAGAFLNKVLPELVLTALLVALLTFTAYTTFAKARTLYKKETRALQEQGLRDDGTKASELTLLARKQQDANCDSELDEDEDPELEVLDDGEPVDKLVTPDVTSQAEQFRFALQPSASFEPTDRKPAVNKPLQEILEAERHIPIANLQILGALFVVVLAINLLKGGGAFKSPLGITCGSTAFWVSNGAMMLWIFAITWMVRRFLVRKNRAKLDCGYPFVEGDIQWDERATLVYPLVCCLAGFTAGMFGIGGGIGALSHWKVRIARMASHLSLCQSPHLPRLTVKGPLMLAMGVHPAVSSASSACMILFTSFTATTSYVVFGLLVPDFALACLILGFAATFAGQVGLAYVMERTGKRYSYIAYSVAIVVLLSAFLMTVQSLLSLAEGETHHAGGICGRGD